MIAITIGTLFCIASICDILFTWRNKKQARYISKSLLMPLLAVFYMLSAVHISFFIVAALVCCFMGDFFLLWTKKESLFLGGLVSFLMGHIFYIIVFIQAASCLSFVPAWFYLILLAYAAIGGIIFSKLRPGLGDMKIPVLLYLCIICAMSFASLTRMWDVDSLSFWLPVSGSFLFMISDTILAFNMFIAESKIKGVIVMITYILAQVLIVLGFMGQ